MELKINYVVLKESCEMFNYNIMMEFLSIFKKDYDRSIEKLEIATSDNNLLDAKNVCHKLIGEMANISIEVNPRIKANDMDKDSIVLFLDALITNRSSLLYGLEQYIHEFYNTTE